MSSELELQLKLCCARPDPWVPKGTVMEEDGEEVEWRGMTDTEWNKFKEDEQEKLMVERERIGKRRTVVDGSCAGTSVCSESDIESESMCSSSAFSKTTASKEDFQVQYQFTRNRKLDLAVFKYREQILELVNDNNVVVISGHTGCGKTTQIPQFILEQKSTLREPVNIIVTQPRKIAAKSIAERVCNERGWHMGGLVGYHVGLDKMNKSPDTRLLYVTTGVLKMMLINDLNIANTFTHIILDEVHERDLDVDFILAYLKKVMMTTYSKFRLVLMSATITEENFQAYFAERIDGRLVKAPSLKVGRNQGGTNKPVSVNYLNDFKNVHKPDLELISIHEPQLYPKAMEICASIIQKLTKMDGNSEKPGAVLAFLPGIFEIEAVAQYLRTQMKQSEGPPLNIIPLHSSISWQEHSGIFVESSPNERKVILSTNIAESSVTIPDIVYVIDFCLTKRLEADASTGYPQLKLCWASKQQLEQRKGRVGRVAAGHVFRLVPKRLADNLDAEQSPEMLRVPLTKLVLEIKLCNFGSPKQLMAICMDPPNGKDIDSAVQNLKLIGALLPTLKGEDAEDDGDITVLGQIVAKLPVDVLLGKMIVLGHIFGVLEDMVIIAAGLNGKSIFSTFFSRKLASYTSKLHWAGGTASDFVAILQAYKTWSNKRESGTFSLKRDGSKTNEKEFCKQFNLQLNQLHEMKLLINEIHHSLEFMRIISPRVGQAPPATKIDPGLLRDIVIFGAFYPNYFYKYHNSEREKEAYKTLESNDPTCSVYFSFPGDHCKYGELYKNQVKKILSPAIAEKDIDKIQFCHSKIVVTLKKDAHEMKAAQGRIGENFIPDNVLTALKLGKTNQVDMKLNLYDTDKAELCLKNLKIKDAGRLSTKLSQLEAPDMNESKIKFKLLHVESPSSFWIEREDLEERHVSLMQMIHKNIDKCPIVERLEFVKVGDVYLAPDSHDGHLAYYRARVESKYEDSRIKIFFVDHGSSLLLNYRQLRMIAPELRADLSIPAIAVECSISSIQPNQTRGTIHYWDQESVKAFKKLFLEGDNSSRGFLSDIYSVIPSNNGVNKYLIKLSTVQMYNEKGHQVEVRQWLLDNQYAETNVESFISQERAKERAEYCLNNDAMKNYLNRPGRYNEEEESQYNIERGLETMAVKLKGPLSPLVTTILSAHKPNWKSVGKAKIESDSVNSILLDFSPRVEHNVWMVAAQLQCSAGSGDILLRNTSWLPSRPGLGQFFAMMFAPRVQIRVNKPRTNYTGCLLGLGYKMESSLSTRNRPEWKSLNPQFDMEIDFDCRVGMDELNMINEIRSSLSELLSTGPEGVWRINQVKLLHNKRDNIMMNLNLLLSKELAYKEVELKYGSESYVWWGVNTKPSEEIFREIEAPCLIDWREEIKKLELNLEMNGKKEFNEVKYCPACSRTLSCPDQIYHHMRTEEHKLSASRLGFYEKSMQ